MVLDNWGDVRTWTALEPITSRGPSGIGFVNFSDIKTLQVQAPIRTFGKGARGFNLYDGSLGAAVFDSIETHGDGSIGVQLSRPLPKLTITHDLSTEGGEGLSLVKGVQTTLKAIALSIKPGGALGELHVGGSISTSGDDVVSVELADRVGSWDVPGGVRATGQGSDGLHYTSPGAAPEGITVSSQHGTDTQQIPPRPENRKIACVQRADVNPVLTVGRPPAAGLLPDIAGPILALQRRSTPPLAARH